MFQGCGTALVTPFQKNGSLDEAALRRLVRRQIEAGIHFLVPVGTTGESPTLSLEEHLRVVEIVVAEANGQVPVLAGAGGYWTDDVIDLIERIEKLGVDGILSVTPYYNRPTQEGLYQHYKALAKATRLPIILYSVQGRTGVNIEPATVKRLAAIRNIIGIKEASGSMAQVARIVNEVPEGFLVLSGDDSVTIPLMALGGHGVISVVANQIPGEMANLAEACLNQDFGTARAIQRHYLPLMEVNFIQSNPIPVKASLARMGLCKPVWRLPLVPPSAPSLDKIQAVMAQVGIAK
ncbi:MAG: 4-hydroxy-tetrahydrodipicolinate synthase [Acidobacteriota bacterium]